MHRRHLLFLLAFLAMLGVAALLALVAALGRSSAARPDDVPDYGHVKGKRAAPVTIARCVMPR